MKLLVIVNEYPNLNKKELTDKMGISRETVDCYLRKLIDKGLVEKVGSRKSVGYIVNRK